MSRDYPTIDELLAEIKKMKAGWGGETKIKNMVIGSSCYSLSGFDGIKVLKYGRGSKREHDMIVLFSDNKE